jgi:diguanylate cyclase (GGDEF)-like protein/PAS domain S-box-containing protein
VDAPADATPPGPGLAGARHLAGLVAAGFDVAHALVIQVGDGEMVLSNAAADRLLGPLVQDLGGRTPSQAGWRLVRPDGEAVDPDDLPPAVATRLGRPVDDELLGVAAPGRPVVWVQVTSAPIVGSDGRCEGVISSFVDVTELQVASERVVEVLDAMTDGFCTVDEDFRLTYCNPAAADLWGRTPADVSGTLLWEVFPESAGSELERRLGYAMASRAPTGFEVHAPRQDRWYEVRAHAVSRGLAVTFRDVTWRRSVEVERNRLLEEERQAREAAEASRQEMEHAATHDPLTGLANRSALFARLRTDLGARAERGRCVAVCYLDLDQFKAINDTYGHREGDRLLVRASRRLAGLVRSGDLVARVGGDEFVVTVDAANDDEVLAVAQRIVRGLREPFTVSGRLLVVTTSVGVAVAGEGATPESLLHEADAALYRAKADGRDRVRS